MKKLAPYFIAGLCGALLAGRFLDVARLFLIFQPVSVCLSIMVAAIFVRLNRGMPSLEWKSLDLHQRKNVTSAVLRLAHDYVVGLMLTVTTIMILIVLSGIGVTDAVTYRPEIKAGAVFVFTFSLMSSFVWMGYVVWRDYDVVRLQKRIIDDAAEREDREKNVKIAEDKVASMKASGVNVKAHSIVP